MGRMSSVYRVGVKFMAITARNFVADEMNAGSIGGHVLASEACFGPIRNHETNSACSRIIRNKSRSPWQQGYRSEEAPGESAARRTESGVSASWKRKTVSTNRP